MTNFGSEPFPLDTGEVVLISSRGDDGVLAGQATAWLRRAR